MGTAFAKRSNQMTKKSMSYPYLLITQSSGVNHKGYYKFQIIYMPRILPNTTKISTIINHKVISGEALNLKWDDVDLKNNIIAIKGTKTKYDRYVPISKPFKDLLSGINKNQDCLYVFNRDGVKLTDFKRSFHTACKAAGFKDMHIHDLRHVYASKMVMNGTSLFITGELLGHRTTQMTKRYSHLVPETLKKQLTTYGARIRISY